MLQDDEHPIDRVLTAYFDRNHQISRSQSNNYKSETRLLLQRQRVIRSFLHKAEETEPSIRKPMTLKTKPQGLTIRSIPSPQVLFADLNEPTPSPSLVQSASSKKEIQRQTPFLVRRAPSIQASFDFTQIPPHQIAVALPTHFTFRNPSERSSPKISHLNTKTTKILREPMILTKSIQRNSSQTIPKWTPKLFEQETLHQRTMHSLLRSKTLLSKTPRSHAFISSPTQMNSFQDLHISPRLESEKKRQMDGQYENLLDDNDDDDDDADGDSSIATCNSRLSPQRTISNTSDSSSSLSQTKILRLTTKRNSIRRVPYSLALPPLVEHLYDEETGDELI